MERRKGSPARVLAPVVALALVGALALVTGCGRGTPARGSNGSAPQPAAEYPVTVTDDASRTVTIKARPQRIVSLAPANTEILFALGAGDRVVGVTTYDDYPPEVAGIEKVGDFAGPNLEAVAAAEPDVVFVTTGVQADVIGKLEQLGATVVAIDPPTLEALYEDIEEIAAIVGEREAGSRLVERMRAEAEAVRAAVSGREPVTAFVEIGAEPLFTAGSGTLISELITLAGGTNVVAQEGYVPFSVEELVKADPAVYLATKSSGTDAATIAKRPGYKGLSAVKNGRVVILDDNLVSRPGPRIVQGLKSIAEGLHPDAFER